MRKKNKNSKLKFIARWHAVFSLISFCAYVALGSIYSPEFLFSDVRHKFQALADDTIVITAKVLGPPNEPVVTGSASCVNDSPVISLNWADDENSETFSVDRDNSTLATGLTDSQYEDSNALFGNTSYEYVVTAFGPMGPGSAESDPITVMTPANCGVPAIDPTVVVTAFASKSVASYHGTPHTTSQRPWIAGITNIPNATIALFLPGSPIISTQVAANANGYWSWRPAINLSDRHYNLLVTATDPNNPSISVSTTFSFRIDKKQAEAKGVAPSGLTARISKEEIDGERPAGVPLDFSLTAKNEVYQGEELKTNIHIEKLLKQYEGKVVKVAYQIFNVKGKKVSETSEDRTVFLGADLAKNIPLPAYFSGGKYEVRAEISIDGYSISRKRDFMIKPVPFCNLGGGFVITYPELLSKIGTASIILLLLLFLWLILFYREYWLYLHALRHITERNLEKIGLFGPRRGRGVLK